MLALPALYERAIAEAAKRKFAGDPTAESALRAFWTGYIDTLVGSPPHSTIQCNITNYRNVSELQRIGEAGKTVFTRASRSVPGSGEVWARFIRFLVGNDLWPSKHTNLDSFRSPKRMRTTPWTGESLFQVSRIQWPRLLDSLTARGEGLYTRGLATGLIQKDVEQIVAIVLARAGAERRKAEANPEGDIVYRF